SIFNYFPHSFYLHSFPTRRSSDLPRQTDERLRILDEHGLADEEVPKVHPQVDPRIQPLLHRQLDTEPDGQRAGFRSALVDGLHRDRKSTRLNSSHVSISYAVFCLK